MRKDLIVGLCLAVIITGAVEARQVKEKGLVGYWSFDEGKGDMAEDHSGNENDGEIKDAEWVKGKVGFALKFDGKGNYTIGITEQIVFPEIEYDKVPLIHGMDITIVTTAESNEEARGLLSAFGFPLKR